MMFAVPEIQIRNLSEHSDNCNEVSTRRLQVHLCIPTALPFASGYCEGVTQKEAVAANILANISRKENRRTVSSFNDKCWVI
jgi:hypothetical protein